MKTSELIECLKDPKIYPYKIKSEIKVIQTHISVVFLTGKYAYKIKKPVDFGFLDYSTLEKRKENIIKEYKINKKICPEIYEGVLTLNKTQAGLELNGEGEVVEYVLKMRELPQEFMMKKRLEKDQISRKILIKIAEKLSKFYDQTDSTEEIRSHGKLKSIKKNIFENFDQVEPYIGRTISQKKYRKIKKSTKGFMKNNKELFKNRIEQNQIKDCHGDLKSENIFIDKENKVYIFDRIEFNKRFRYSDIVEDIAYLAMELDFMGKEKLSKYFVNSFYSFYEDRGIFSLLDFYKAYRAYVKGKILGFRLDDENIPENKKEKIAEEAKNYFDLVLKYTKDFKLVSKIRNQNDPPVDQPLLFVISGLPGTGKTTLAGNLSEIYRAKILRTDVIRKEIFEPKKEDLYSQKAKKKVYAAMRDKGSKILNKGRNCILDATFKSLDQREKVRKMAKRNNAVLVLVKTVCNEDEIKRRMNQRNTEDTASDAGWQVYEKLKKNFDPIQEDSFLEVDTTFGGDLSLRELDNFIKKLKKNK